MRIPKVGEKIYVPGSMYVYRGSDDFAGGIATISNVDVDDYDNPTRCYINIKERPGSSYNWGPLEIRQEELKKMYGEEIAHPDPDDRPEFNDDEADWHA